jgi:hypothetical protein
MTASTTSDVRTDRPARDVGEVSFSNGVRLAGREWVIVSLFAVLMVSFMPSLWERMESFEPVSDYRLPYDLSQDYWLYDRYSRMAAAQYPTILIGDSVVWGQYVTPQQTLSHWLNQLQGEERFANLGLDGAHPAALVGLMDHYASGISGKTVIIQCNLLWMSSPRVDLQGTEDFAFNHPRLVPQFVPSIPCYKEQISARIGIMVEQRSVFSSWTNHLQQAYFGGADVPSWTMEHPYANPAENLGQGLPTSDSGLRNEPVSWTKRGIKKQTFSWVDPQTSFQWRCFRQAVDILRRRGNRVFVVVGPFNEHIMDAESLKGHEQVKLAVLEWLQQEKIACLAPPALPSDLYADASHPLSAGYAMLARQLVPYFPKESKLP